MDGTGVRGGEDVNIRIREQVTRCYRSPSRVAGFGAQG